MKDKDSRLMLNMEVDPYFILGVSKNDSIQLITKEFRKKAKRYHPDKYQDSEEKDNATRQFKIIVDAYSTICNEIQGQTSGIELRDDFKKQSKEVETVNFEDPMSVHKFNDDFNKKRKKKPQDFGYGEQPRLGERISGDINEDPANINWGAKISEYNTFNYKPTQIIDKDNFNRNDFNKMFEYNQQSIKFSDERGLVERTTDGFMAANSDAGGYANVSSYNGLLLVGDDHGLSGVGYDSNNYGDYKYAHMNALNPVEKCIVPSDFKSVTDTTGLSEAECKRRIRERELESSRVNNIKYTKSFNQMDTEFELKKSESMRGKIQKDTLMIEQYKNVYPEQVFDQARQGTLDTSKSYIGYIDTKKTIEDNLLNGKRLV